MAVDIRESYRDESSSAEGDLKTGSRFYARYFTAVTTAGEKPSDVRAHIDMPQIGDAKPGDISLRVRRVLVRAVSPYFFACEAQYESPGPHEEDDPFDLRPDIQTSHAKIEEPIDEDIHGNPIATACGEPYENVTEPKDLTVISIARNMPAFNYLLADEYTGAVNADPFLGYAPGRCKIEEIASSNVYDGDYEYWRVTVVIYVKQQGKATSSLRTWWKRLRHEGHYELVPDILQNRHPPIGMSIIRAIDDRGEPMASKVSLRPDGQRETDPTKAYFKEYETVYTKPFSALGIL